MKESKVKANEATPYSPHHSTETKKPSSDENNTSNMTAVESI